jgi:hypothetical protein
LSKTAVCFFFFFFFAALERAIVRAGMENKSLIEMPPDVLYLCCLELDYISIERLGTTCRFLVGVSRRNALWFAQFQAIRAARSRSFDVDHLNYHLAPQGTYAGLPPTTGDREGIWTAGDIFTRLTWRPTLRKIREIRLAFHFDRILLWLSHAKHGVHIEFIEPPPPPPPPTSVAPTASLPTSVAATAAPAITTAAPPDRVRVKIWPPHDFLLSRRTMLPLPGRFKPHLDEEVEHIDDCTMDTRKLRANKLNMHGEEVAIQLTEIWSTAFATVVSPLTNPSSSFTHRSNEDPMTLVLDHDETKTHHILRMPLKRLITDPMTIWRTMFRLAWIDDMRSEQAIIAVENLVAFYETKFSTQLGYETVQGQLSDEAEHKMAAEIYHRKFHVYGHSAYISDALSAARSAVVVPSASSSVKRDPKAAKLLKKRKQLQAKQRRQQKTRKLVKQRERSVRLARGEDISSSSFSSLSSEEEEKDSDDDEEEIEDKESDRLAYLKTRKIERYPIVTPFLSIDRVRQMDRDKPGLSVRCRICATPVAIGDSEPFTNEATSSLMPIVNQSHRYCSTRCLRHSLNRFGIERVSCANPRCTQQLPMSSVLGVVLTSREIETAHETEHSTRDNVLAKYSVPIFRWADSTLSGSQYLRQLHQIVSSRHLHATYEALGGGLHLFSQDVRTDMVNTYEFLVSNRCYWNSLLKTIRGTAAREPPGDLIRASSHTTPLDQLTLMTSHWLAHLPTSRSIAVLGDELQGVQNAGWQDRLKRYQLFRNRLSVARLEENMTTLMKIQHEEKTSERTYKLSTSYSGDIHAGSDLPFATLGLGLPVVQTFFPMPQLQLVPPSESVSVSKSLNMADDKREMSSILSLAPHEMLVSTHDYELTAMRSKFKAYCSSWCAHEPKTSNPYRSNEEASRMTASRCCNPKCQRVLDVASSPLSMECLELIRVVVQPRERGSNNDCEEEDVRSGSSGIGSDGPDAMDLDDAPTPSSRGGARAKRKHAEVQDDVEEEPIRREEHIGYVCDEHCVDAYFKAKIEYYKLQRAQKRAKLSASPEKKA